MVALVYSVMWVLIAWRLVSWQYWKMYYPTALFAALGNALYEMVCAHYQLWHMEPNGLPNSTLPMLMLTIIGMPLSTMVYLSRYPESSFIKQACYILLFVGVFVTLEALSVRFGSITYHNGWNLFYSFLFNCMMFPVLRLHHRHTGWGLIVSAFVVFMLAVMTGLTIDKMK